MASASHTQHACHKWAYLRCPNERWIETERDGEERWRRETESDQERHGETEKEREKEIYTYVHAYRDYWMRVPV